MQHPYIIEIPKGYQYCPDCELLTPHTLDSQINPSKSMPEDFTCDICGKKKEFGYYQCPVCGWEHDPDRDISPLSIDIKKHTQACWDAQNQVGDQMKSLIEDKCDCPKVKAYPIQHIYNYRSTPAHWNMECSNAIEWSYEIMCNVCNYVFEVEDGNC